MAITKTILIFIVAGLCEIGGGYLVWLTIKDGKSPWLAVLGSTILILYGFVATMQTSNFARVYATYGGFFIMLSFLWAYKFDNFIPDKFDVIGVAIVLIGVAIIYFAPRS
jgi:small multidrug resistance family-3 protein